MKHKNQSGKKNPPVAKASAKPVAKEAGSSWMIAVTLILVLIAYIPVFNAGFVNWDDDDYVVKNKTITSFSNMGSILTVPVQGNYHPLTMLSLALNYAISGLNPLSYHVLNLILHLLNTFLVYRLASRLSNNSSIISFTTALLFGIHPLHVESVAWVSERKDVLYAFFFLLGLLKYMRYKETNSRKDYLFTFLWFVLSILSKPAAIIFPAVLFLFDFYYKRKIDAKIFLEKIPFFLVAFVFAYLTVTAQHVVGAMDKTEVFTPLHRVMFAFYGYAAYFLKMIFPFNLVAFYPTPPINQPLPSYFYAAPLFFIATVVVCLLTWKKNRVITFGLAFYFVNLLLVLQLVVVGSALIAERYTYIPLIGLFFILGWYLEKTFRTKPSTAYTIIIALGVILAPVTFNQAGTWKNGEALWENVIKKNPSAKAYIIRADELSKKGNKEKALAYFTKAIDINQADPEAFGNRGNIYFDFQQDSLALMDYNKALALNPNYVPALSNRGALFSRRGAYEEGMRDLEKAISLKPDYGPAYKNRGTTHLSLRQFDKAISDFRKYLEYEPKEVEIYNAIGVCYQNAGNYNASLQPFTDAISKDPLPLYYMNRSISYRALGKIEEAKRDAMEARGRGMKLDPEYERILGL
jgi:tetratricopeptide (TPR) repeat protein